MVIIQDTYHDITGRALLRITDITLQRMGITNNCDREAIWREIVKQRLKTDILEIRDMERVNMHYQQATHTSNKNTNLRGNPSCTQRQIP
ncbi:protein aveugle isoform X2 [Scaptodrosophila lebanonensis]|uniref:Protein aveugle isoform X2 n=1 Tax=Drosophila lebanonensis TaxID=7225 RepID=A0A6J2U7I6_DROLE|nr:protein aveugle isoform X2 [Scaptodrosophila lebanonensis]